MPQEQDRPCITLATTGQPKDDESTARQNASNSATPDKPTACGWDDGEPKERAGHVPVRAQQTPHPTCRPRQEPDNNNLPQQAAHTGASARRNQLGTCRLHNSSGRMSTGRSGKDLATNKPTIRRLTQPWTKQTAAKQVPDHKQTTGSRPTPNQPSMQELTREWRPVGWQHHGAPRPPTTIYPGTQQNTATLPLCNRQTNSNELLRTTGPPGEHELDRFGRREYAARHASPLVRASSSCLKPTENQPRWGCMQDKDSGPPPGPWAPESGG